MKREGRRRLRQSLELVLGGKAEKLRLFPAQLGAYVNGQKTLRVAGRTDFVWARLRGATSEVIQAINETTAYHWDLPVLVYRDPRSPDVWKVYGRDVRAYTDWEGASYLPPHADSHSFANAPRTGSDVVWVQKRQYMPLLPHPVATGSMGVYVEPDFYYFDGAYHWWPGSGTSDLSSHKPTGANGGRFVTVYISGSAGVLALVDGPEFNAIFPPGDPGAYISLPDTNAGIPVVAVFLLTGSSRIGWGELYDLRWPGQVPSPVAGISGSLIVHDEGALLGSFPHMNFVGAGVTVTASGSFATVSIPGGGGGSGSVMLSDEGTIQGSVTQLDVRGSRLTAYVSGSYGTIESSPDPAELIGVMGQDEGVPLGTGTTLNAVGAGVTATLSGTVLELNIPGGSGNPPITGSIVLADEGLVQGSITKLNVRGDGVIASVSGSVGDIRVLPPGEDQIGFLVMNHAALFLGTGTFLFTDYGLDVTLAPGPTIATIFITPPISGSVIVRDEGSPLGSAHILDFVGPGVTATISGSYASISIPGGGGSPAGVVAWDEGIPQGTGTIINAVGAGITLTRSGSVIELNVPGSGNPPTTGTVVLRDEGAVLGSIAVLDVRGARAVASVSGSYGILTISPDPVELIGVMGQEEGVPLGTGTTLNVIGAGVTATLSGTVLQLNIPGGAAGAGSAGVMGWDDGVPLGTGTVVDFGDSLDASISGTVLRADVNLAPPDVRQDLGGFTFPLVLVANANAAATGTTETLRQTIGASGTPVDGFGLHNDYYAENDIGEVVLIARMGLSEDETADSTENVALTWDIVQRGTIRQVFRAGDGTGRPTFSAFMPSGAFASPQASAVFRSGPGYASVGDGFGPKMLFQTVSQTGTTQNSGALAFAHNFSSGTSEAILQVRQNQADTNVQYEVARMAAGGIIVGLTSAGVPTPSGTYQGPGSINVADGYYINGVRLGTVTTGTFSVRELLYDVVLGSATGSIVLSPILQTYDHLAIELFSRGDTAAVSADIQINLNGDTTDANYRLMVHVALDGTHNIFPADSNTIASMPAATAPANVFGWATMDLPFYAVTGAHHVIRGWSEERRAAASSIMAHWHTNWERLEAITFLSLVPTAGSFIAGTRCRVYGMGDRVLVTSVK